MFDQSAHRG
jgi:lipase ATG15